jgi:hypothetical protein
LIGKQEKSTNPLGFGQWQRVEAKTTLALKAHGRDPLVKKCARAIGFATLAAGLGMFVQTAWNLCKGLLLG